MLLCLVKSTNFSNYSNGQSLIIPHHNHQYTWVISGQQAGKAMESGIPVLTDLKIVYFIGSWGTYSIDHKIAVLIIEIQFNLPSVALQAHMYGLLP